MDNTDLSPAQAFLNYQTQRGLFDELYHPDGSQRPHWDYLMRALAALGENELNLRQQEINRLLRDNGVAYNAYSDSQQTQRPWLLDLLPFPLPSEDWRSIEQALMQRAELFRQLLADLYGPRDLIRRGLIPPECIYSHPGFLRPCVATEPSQEKAHLPLYAADLARTPDGSWLVTDDRSQVPSGAGYALENRLVLSRVMPSLFRDSQVHRIALYFRTLRNTLMNMARRDSDDIRIVFLTPGPGSETYFEHAYLARYLGYTLVEGADLAVRDQRVWLKTLDGLQAVDVILRYVDDALCDPLELRADSLFGCAGLLQAARSHQVAIANPLGSGVLENPALLPFLPALAQHLLGEDLLLPSPQTYWCGNAQERQHVLNHLGQLMIKRCVRSPGGATIDGAQLSAKQQQKLRASILATPYAFVAQEPVAPATIPVLENGQLRARQVILRSFLVANEDDYVAFPGGLCRLAADEGLPIDAVQSGGVSKDTWVLASEPVQTLSLIQQREHNQDFAIHRGELPSRVAENLFWLGRYAERSESLIRLLRAVLLYLLDPDDGYSGGKNSSCLHHLLQAVTTLTETQPGFIGEGCEERLQDPDEELRSILIDQQRVGSLPFTLKSLLYAAHSVRDRISPDVWRVFNAIDEGLKQLQTPRGTLQFSTGDNEIINSALDALNRLLNTCAAFTGLSMDSMTHSQGWKFLMIGRRLERAHQSTLLLQACLLDVSDDETLLLEYLLRICDSLMTYRSRYRSQIQLQSTLELLLQDETNPRSIVYQLRHLQKDIEQLPSAEQVFIYRRAETRTVLALLSALRLAQVGALAQIKQQARPQLEQLLTSLTTRLPNLATILGHTYFSHAEQPQQLVRLSGTD